MVIDIQFLKLTSFCTKLLVVHSSEIVAILCSYPTHHSATSLMEKSDHVEIVCLYCQILVYVLYVCISTVIGHNQNMKRVLSSLQNYNILVSLTDHVNLVTDLSELNACVPLHYCFKVLFGKELLTQAHSNHMYNCCEDLWKYYNS